MKNEKVYSWLNWFKETLTTSEQIKIKASLLLALNRQQVNLWQALNIYDDFLDGEGEQQKLPLANSYFRSFLKTYYQLNLPADFYKLFEKIFDDLDQANQREASQVKIKIKNNQLIIPKKLPSFPPLIFLAKKSLVLALGAIALLSFLGNKTKSSRIQTTLKFWRYALAAKQLADDACDWFDDLKTGKITPVNVLVLKEAQKNKIKLNLQNKPEVAYLLFALIAPLVISNLNQLCFQARREAKKLGWSKNNKLIKELIQALEKASEKALKFQKLLV